MPPAAACNVTLFPLSLVWFKSWDDKPFTRTVCSDLGDGKGFDSRDDELALVGMTKEHLLEGGAGGCRLDFGP